MTTKLACLAVAVICTIGAMAMSPTPTTATSGPATRPAADKAEIERLIKQLGSEKVAEREAAQRALTEIGRAATDWSTPEDGVQIRLRTDRTAWRVDEIPVLRWDARNMGSRKFLTVGAGQRLAQLEVDGVWHQWPIQMRGGALPDLGAGKSLEDQTVTVSPIWEQARPEDLRWGRGGGFVIPSDAQPSLLLAPGKHVIRVAVIAEPSRVDTGNGFRVVSGPLEITVEPLPASEQAGSWPPQPKLAAAAKEALFAVDTVLQDVYRPSEPWVMERVKLAKAKADLAATLAENTRLQTSTKQMADAIDALQTVVGKTPAEAAKEFAAAGDAYRLLLVAFTGENLLPANRAIITASAPATGPATRPATQARDKDSPNVGSSVPE